MPRLCPCEALRWLAHRLGRCTVTCHGRSECGPVDGTMRPQVSHWLNERVLDIDELWHERRWPWRRR